MPRQTGGRRSSDILRIAALGSLCQCSHAFSVFGPSRLRVCQTEKPQLSSPGQIVDVTCEGDATQSYALYLPSTYAQAKLWPIIYFFDPGGRGRRPLELYKDLAREIWICYGGFEQFPKLLVQTSRQSVNSIWLDTHRASRSIAISLTSVDFPVALGLRGLMALTCPSARSRA